MDLPLAVSVLPKIVATLTQLWLSQKIEVTTGATHALEMLLKDAVAPACATEQLVQQNHSKLLKCFNLLEQGLSYQYHNVWHQVLYTLKIMFEVNRLDYFVHYVIILKVFKLIAFLIFLLVCET